MKFLKKNFLTIILSLMLLLGIGLLVYPSFSDYWNSLHQSRAIASYAEAIAATDDDRFWEILKSAEDYNRRLAYRPFELKLSEEEEADYKSQLDILGTGIMSFIEIPKIKCSLPIYHGTDEAVLQIAVGHVEGTSLPVGGESAHCVLSGHRGLPSARLFTDIDRLVVGDEFYINTLDEIYSYEVDQINIVLPHETDLLEIEEGGDYCTLVTCTPYGVNTHRLLVRGHRVETTVDKVQIRVTADALQIEPVIVAPIVAAPILLVLLIWVMRPRGRKDRSRGDLR